VMVMQTIPQSFPKVWVVRIADGGGPARQMWRVVHVGGQRW
jgi:hypothetical protein